MSAYKQVGLRNTVFGLALFGAACSGKEATLGLYFPSVAAQAVTSNVFIGVYARIESGDVPPCETGAFTGQAELGQDPEAPPLNSLQVDYPFTGPVKLGGLTNGPIVVYVRGTAAGGAAIVEGCDDSIDLQQGDSGIVDVDLDVVIPSSARLDSISGDGQVRDAAGLFDQALKVRVLARSPSGSEYGIPGVPVRFEMNSSLFSIVDASGSSMTALTDTAGELSIRVSANGGTGSGEVMAVADAIGGNDRDNPQTVPIPCSNGGVNAACRTKFRVRVAPKVQVQTRVSWPLSAVTAQHRTVDIAIGDVYADAGVDLVALGCNGPEANCRVGTCRLADCGALPRAPEMPFGPTSLTVLPSIRTGPDSAEARSSGLGWLPADLELGSFSSDLGGGLQMAVLNARTDGASEGSEVRLVGRTLDSSVRTLTAKNALALAGYRRPVVGGGSGGYAPLLGLAAAGQGRSENKRSCNLSASAQLSPFTCTCDCEDLSDESSRQTCRRDCGTGPCPCPPGESCVCPEGADCKVDAVAPGVCSAGDAQIDLLEETTYSVTTGGPSQTDLLNIGGCQEADTGACGPRAPECKTALEAVTASSPIPVVCGLRHQSSPPGPLAEGDQCCSCGDRFRGNRCQSSDAISAAAIPTRIRIGDSRGFVTDIPFGVAAGPIGGLASGSGARRRWGLLVPTTTGINGYEYREEYLVSLPRVGVPTRFELSNAALDVNKGVERVVVAVLERNERIPQDPVGDMAWISGVAASTGCTDSSFINADCPIARALPGTETERGCLGVVLSKDLANLEGVATLQGAECRRFRLAFQPSDFCVGDFNNDGLKDIAVSAKGPQVLVFSGDGEGGYMDPPTRIDVPEAVAKMACADINGDGYDDFVVLGLTLDDAHLVTFGP
jgi:hypothetical protein